MGSHENIITYVSVNSEVAVKLWKSFGSGLRLRTLDLFFKFYFIKSMKHGYHENSLKNLFAESHKNCVRCVKVTPKIKRSPTW